MKAFKLFHFSIFVIWLGLLGFCVLAGDLSFVDVLLILLCFTVVFGLPVLVVVDVIWLIVLAVARRLRQKAQLAGEHDRSQGTVDVTLTDFLRKAKERGMSDEQINRRCRANGWSDAEFQQARRLLSGEGV